MMCQGVCRAVGTGAWTKGVAYRTVRADDIEPTSECAVLRLCLTIEEGGYECTGTGDPSLHLVFQCDNERCRPRNPIVVTSGSSRGNDGHRRADVGADGA